VSTLSDLLNQPPTRRVNRVDTAWEHLRQKLEPGEYLREREAFMELLRSRTHSMPQVAVALNNLVDDESVPMVSGQHLNEWIRTKGANHGLV